MQAATECKLRIMKQVLVWRRQKNCLAYVARKTVLQLIDYDNIPIYLGIVLKKYNNNNCLQRFLLLPSIPDIFNYEITYYGDCKKSKNMLALMTILFI